MTTPNETSKAVSVVGLGAMGSTIARLLLGAGYRVTVWNRTTTKAQSLVEQGAVLASHPAEAFGASPITILCVHDYKATDTILAADGVAAQLDGRTLIQLTTGSPQEAREAEDRAKKQGAEYLDGAIQVAPDQMAQADTTILLSGAKTAFLTSEAVLRVLGGNLIYLGDKISAASAMDMATLSCLYGTLLGFFHGALLCEAEGFGVDLYGSIIAGTMPGFGEFLKHEGAVIQAGDYAVSQSPLSISAEATERILRSARESRLDTDFPALAASLFRKAMAAGYGNEELASAIKVLRQSA